MGGTLRGGTYDKEIRESGPDLRPCRHGRRRLLPGVHPDPRLHRLDQADPVHPHYFLLGMVFFLLLALLEKAFRFSDWKHTGKALALYQVGLNATALGFLARGVMEVLGTQLSRGLNASISGVAGIGHVMLGVSMVLLLVQIKKKAE